MIEIEDLIEVFNQHLEEARIRMKSNGKGYLSLLRKTLTSTFTGGLKTLIFDIYFVKPNYHGHYPLVFSMQHVLNANKSGKNGEPGVQKNAAMEIELHLLNLMSTRIYEELIDGTYVGSNSNK